MVHRLVVEDHIRSNLVRTLGTMTLSGRSSSSSSPSRRVSSQGGGGGVTGRMRGFEVRRKLVVGMDRPNFKAIKPS